MAVFAAFRPKLSDVTGCALPIRLASIKPKRFALILGCFWVHCLISSQSLAVDSEPQAEVKSRSDLVLLIERAQQNIERLSNAIGTGDARVAAHVADELQLWEEMELVVSQRKSIQEDIAALDPSIDESGLALHPATDQPESFLEFDDLQDEFISKRQQLESLQSELHAEKEMLVNTKRRYQEAEQQRRRLAEVLQANEATDKTNLLREQSLKVLAGQVLANQLDLGRDQIELTAKRLAAMEQEVARMEGILSANAGKFRLTQHELDARLRRIEDFESRLWDQLSEVNERMRAAMRLRNSDGSAANETAYQVAHEESELLQQVLSEVNNIRDCWQKRFQLSKGNVSASQIAQWLEETEQAKQRLEHVNDKLALRSSQCQLSLSSLNRSKLFVRDPKSQAELISDPEVNVDQEIDKQIDELERMFVVYGSVQGLIASGERMYDRFVGDLESRQSQFSLSEWGQLAASGIATGWEYEIATIDDEPITIRKIVFGCLLLLCGYFISRAVASMVAHRLLPKFGLSEAGASVFRTVLFYVLLTVLVFVTLDIVSVPMTVFTFLGGAVAIGLGFGCQNLINNFISGLILLVERPIRVGDLVNVDGIDANVINIGARSTTVRTGANLEILVPNSKFLENNVTNWTHSDTRIRTCVSVGVAYGSPVQRVIAELRKVIDQHEKVIQAPEPIVLFQDFGDSCTNI